MKTLISRVALTTLLSTTAIPAYAASAADVAALRKEIQSMRQSYESRIAQLEKKLSQVEQVKTQPAVAARPQQASVAPAAPSRDIRDNSFNPSIGVILNGQYRSFSEDEGDIAGFAVGHEGERGKEGLSVEHTELNFSANVDDKFYGSTTAAIAEHEGETEIELEEAFVQTLPGMGLPTGATIKAGRALWTLGYLNEHHTHADDFSDRPLPYRVFLDNTFNDDGVEFTYVLPTNFYSEVGGGIFRGDDYPFGSASGDGVGAWSAFARVGGDIGANQNWRIGGYVLSGDGNRMSNEDVVNFIGDTRLYVADARYTWAPTGNPHEQEVLLQGEYFWRNEDGTYEDTDAATGLVPFDDHSNGWYAQAVYKFLPQWRVGARYSQLISPSVPAGLAGSALDSGGHDPQTYTLMGDWTNSEFSRIRLQYSREELAQGHKDNQFLLQYIMSIGAHGAHKY
jgi:hypothetical protein